MNCRWNDIKSKKFKIFDAHLHTYGTFLPKNEGLISYLDKNNVEKAIITTVNKAASSKIYISKDKVVDNGSSNDELVKRAFENLRKFAPKGQLDHQDVINISNKDPERFYKFFNLLLASDIWWDHRITKTSPWFV